MYSFVLRKTLMWVEILHRNCSPLKTGIPSMKFPAESWDYSETSSLPFGEAFLDSTFYSSPAAIKHPMPWAPPPQHFSLHWVTDLPFTIDWSLLKLRVYEQYWKECLGNVGWLSSWPSLKMLMVVVVLRYITGNIVFIPDSGTELLKTLGIS